MLARMGWRGAGLGATEAGITQPVEAAEPRDKGEYRGMGVQQVCALVFSKKKNSMHYIILSSRIRLRVSVSKRQDHSTPGCRRSRTSGASRAGRVGRQDRAVTNATRYLAASLPMTKCPACCLCVICLVLTCCRISDIIWWQHGGEVCAAGAGGEGAAVRPRPRPRLGIQTQVLILAIHFHWTASVHFVVPNAQ